ncbi:MAG: hypothetical protein J6583_08325 [Gilliamella sp.]|uniref:hypothetical protein n=1 Tax=unclassified Gilliamella TaxID=2685620 RepID=UPI0025DCA889|nr:hypothetical protein [Gilliamella sp.]MCO6544550.1 hypothetical protein [Gilliamella sp.]MCO6547769.1 hypothetical protein [Gilliamella sp.]
MANISLDAINTINTKLGQADAITTLLMLDCDSDMPINDELRAYALDAVSDLINDSKKLFRSETEHKGLQDENQ